MSTTARIVLKYDADRGDGAGAWVPVDSNVVTSTAEQAINAAADDHGDGLYVAIPERSWQPLNITTEKVPRRVASRPPVPTLRPE